MTEELRLHVAPLFPSVGYSSLGLLVALCPRKPNVSSTGMVDSCAATSTSSRPELPINQAFVPDGALDVCSHHQCTHFCKAKCWAGSRRRTMAEYSQLRKQRSPSPAVPDAPYHTHSAIELSCVDSWARPTESFQLPINRAAQGRVSQEPYPIKAKPIGVRSLLVCST